MLANKQATELLLELVKQMKGTKLIALRLENPLYWRLTIQQAITRLPNNVVLLA